MKVNKKQAWIFISLFWVMIYISKFFQDIAAGRLQGHKIDYTFILLYQAGWLFWIPLTFLALKISKAHPIHRSGLRKSFFKHFLFALLISFLHYIFEAVNMYLVAELLYPTQKGEVYFAYFLYTFHIPIFIYFLIVATSQGIGYVLKFQNATIKNLNLEAKLFESQNQALKMQIQPHFLFNTHHSIISLMMQDKKEEAIEMLTGLSDLLRRTLDLPQTDYITMEQEMSMMRLYMAIQETRFSDRLRVEYNIDPRALAAKVPPFILQPLIENAIIHGIAPYSDAGQLNINAAVNNDRLEISVEDDGVGLPEKSFKEGIGLHNIRSRLRNLYDDNFKFILKTHQHKGTIAMVDLPLIYSDP
jgi:two-component system LytT family sensor kinase